jgi:hypothetical protein
MTESLHTNNQMVAHQPTACFQDIPQEVVTTRIFSQLTLATQLQVRRVCHCWEHIIQEVGEAEIREIRVTQKIAISIFNEGVEYPVLFTTKVYREVAIAKYHEVNTEVQVNANSNALAFVVFQLASRGQIKEVLKVVNCIESYPMKIKILARAIALLARDNQFELIKKLESAMSEEDEQNSWKDEGGYLVRRYLARPAIIFALKELLGAGENCKAEKLFNCCWMPTESTPEARRELLLAHIDMLHMHDDIRLMVGNMRRREAQLREEP